MTILLLLLCTFGQMDVGNISNTNRFRLGFSYTASIPSIQNEKDFADMTTDAGLSFQLGTLAQGMSVDLLGDISDRFRFRGGVSFLNLEGSYSEDFNAGQQIILAIITLGLISHGSNEVIDLNDQAISVEAEAYYILTKNQSISLSVGAGPIYTFASRSLNTPLTVTSGSGNGFGFLGSVRLDQESYFKFFGLKFMFGLEAGYRMNRVNLSDEEADNYELDFSGPFLKFGPHIGF